MPRRNDGPYLTEEPNAHGVYEIRWTEDGRSKRKSTGQADYRRAQRVYAEFILALENVIPGGAVTAGQAIDVYLADKSEVMDPNSQLVTFGHLRAHFGEMVLREIEQSDADKYLALRGQGLISFTDAEGVERGGGVARPGTVRRELGMLGTAVNYCIKKKKFKAQDGSLLLTLADKPALELPPAPAPRDRWLTREEAKTFLDACQPDPDAPLTRVYRYVAMLLYTASRKEPVEALPWARISLDRKMVNLAEPGRRVTKKRRGWVPIADELLPILQRAYDERTTEFYLDVPKPPYHAFRAAAKRAGLYENGKYTVSPHVLRHSRATWAAQDGVPFWEIAGMLHDTIATVERNYAHHAPEHLRSAVNSTLLVVGGKDVAAA